MSIRGDVQKFEPGSKIELFELDATPINPIAGILRFHSHLQEGPIWWQGLEYQPWPTRAQGFNMSGDRPATPTLEASNRGRMLTDMCLLYDDLVGAKLTRRRTLRKYLDVVNFPPMRNKLRRSDDIAGANGVPLSPWSGGSNGSNWKITRQGDAWLNETLVAGLNGLGQQVDVANGQQSTFSVEVLPVSQTSDRRIAFEVTVNDVQGRVDFNYNTRSVNVSANLQAFFSGVRFEEIGDGWVRLVATMTGQAGISRWRTMYFNRYGNSAVGEKWLFRKPQIEDGDKVTEFQATSTNLESDRNPTANPNEKLPDEIWYLERKEVETRAIVKWSLSSALDFNGVQIPRRIIVANQCPWRYRGEGCMYAGGPVATETDQLTDNPVLDKCSKTPTGCRLRFGADNPLPYGGFPAAGLMRS